MDETREEKLAERVGFEPTVGFPQHPLSRRALSTAQTPLRGDRLILTTLAVSHKRTAGQPRIQTAQKAERAQRGPRLLPQEHPIRSA